MEIQFEPLKKIPLYMRITQEIKNRLDKLAKRHNTTRTETARKLIINGLDREEK